MTEGCLSSQLLLESSDVQAFPPAWKFLLGWLLWDCASLTVGLWMVGLLYRIFYKSISHSLQRITNLCLPPETILNTPVGSEARTGYMLSI